MVFTGWLLLSLAKGRDPDSFLLCLVLGEDHIFRAACDSGGGDIWHKAARSPPVVVPAVPEAGAPSSSLCRLMLAAARRGASKVAVHEGKYLQEGRWHTG